MSNYFIDGGPGMYVVTAFAALSLTLSTVQLAGPRWEMRGLVWGTLGIVPGIGVLLLSVGITQTLAVVGVVPPDQVNALIAASLSIALFPLHWSLLCGMLLIPLAAFAVTRRRWTVR